ncbi:MAG: aldo/keto reductase [Oscillospiraceae bacterium]|nr:aldo/keto reductase [Oscillospiraceae bacterium]
MQPVLLGNTGISVSPLCFGTLPFSPLQAYTGEPDAAGEVLARAFALGVSFIDTAQLYNNYAALKAGLSRADRNITVASKTYAYTREAAVAAVEEARYGLARDVIDIFLLHEQESEHTLRGHGEALEALYGLKAKGAVRAVGLSTHHVAGVRAAVDAGLDVVHPLLNIEGLGIADGSREDMEEAVAAAMGAGLGVYVMKALGGGHLFRQAREALGYARQWGHSVALGMRDTAEVEAAVGFFKTGDLPPLTGHKTRSLHIADWCTGCGRCAEACGSGALEIVNGAARLKNAGCSLLCGYCGAACPDFCIKVI